MVSVTVKGLTKSFGAVRAVDDVSLKVERGELFFLLGPSGCGKTTLLRVLAGFYPPDAGRVFFDDRDVTDVPAHRRNTGMVFQNYALWPHMSVRENIVFGLEMHRVPAAERRERVDRALEIVQMREFADRSPNQLSGGQQQRVALARALVLEPDVVLMDEPLSNLDAKLRLELRDQIRRIHDRLGLTMIYVTHDQSEALSMADRLAVMNAGRIEQVGTPREIYNRPQSRFVADFIGEANLLPGRIVEAGEEVVVETPAGRLRAVPAHGEAAAGDEVICIIRPERLDVLGPGDRRPNVLEGAVVHTVFMGYHEQYFVRLDDGREMKAFEHDTLTEKARPGDRVALGCRPADVAVIRKEA